MILDKSMYLNFPTDSGENLTQGGIINKQNDVWERVSSDFYYVLFGSTESTDNM